MNPEFHFSLTHYMQTACHLQGPLYVKPVTFTAQVPIDQHNIIGPIPTTTAARWEGKAERLAKSAPIVNLS